MMKKISLLVVSLFLAGITAAQGPNVKVINTTTQPVPVAITSGGSSGAVTQGSTTSGQSGMLTQGAVTTAAPTYTTGQTSPLSLDTAGNLRVSGSGGGAVTIVDGGAVTLGAKADAKSTATDTTPISAISILKQISASVQAPPTQAVTISGNQAVNVAQINGVTPLMGAGNTGTGSPRVTIATDQANVATKELAATATTAQVTASGTAATLVAANATRFKVTFYNESSTLSVYVGPATVTAGNGVLIPALQSRSFKAGILWQVIAPSGSPVVDVVDESY